jgi:alkanesulfonate monooxygenase SsuD/methylene tetrahydromethanopterin reductase-like flavin-dependent oxidoreductase (luciferase family)
MRFCLMLEGQEGVTWSDWLGAARAAERLGFEAIFTSDHYLSVIRHRDRDRGSSDAWTMLGALAASTETIRLGTMVSPVTFRLPASGGRRAAHHAEPRALRRPGDARRAR